MKTAAVICEFNPFHNGHKYLIDKIKAEHADCVVAIMSGHVVQRGDIAIADKFSRAEIALESGCDMVVELPTVFALSSAQRFAKGGVEIAKALSVDMLCFGAEDADIDKLSEIAQAFDNESFKSKLMEYMSSGEYYPKAVSCAIEDILSKEHSEILSKPNNTLAVEYIKALKGSDITPVAIARSGAEHDSDVTSSNIASATHIRNLIRDDKEYHNFTDFRADNFTDINKLETAILYKLRSMSKDELASVPDVTEGLHNRIYDCVRKSNSLEELYLNLKTKRYTLARLRRIILSAMLGITKEDVHSCVKYVRVLGFSDFSKELLPLCSLPLVCKVQADYSALSSDGKRMFDIDVKATELFSLSCVKAPVFINEFTSQIIKK